MLKRTLEVDAAAAARGGAAACVMLDPEAKRACTGSCGHLLEMLLSAPLARPLEVTRLDRLPSRPTTSEPEVVVVRAPSNQPLTTIVGQLRETWRSAAVLGMVCTSTLTEEEFLASLEHDVDDFIFCPCSAIDLTLRLRRLLSDRSHASARVALVGDLELDLLVGESPAFLRAIALVRRLATSAATVLVSGETGVGKGLFARAIHYNGARRSRPFVPVNCSALPDHLFENELFGHVRGAYTDASSAERGIVEEAEGGTLFLDEVDTISPASQAKLLRFLQDGEYRPLGTAKARVADVRVIAGTNADLPFLVDARKFRPDLFHRLNVLTLTVPPLRERASDIPVLARHFLARFGAQYGRASTRLARRALHKLLAYAWPGNVRELEALLHRAVVVSGEEVIQPEDLDLPDSGATAHPRRHAAKDDAVGAFERSYVSGLLAEYHGNVSRAAIAAGRDRRSFQRFLRKHRIDRNAFHDDG